MTLLFLLGLHAASAAPGFYPATAPSACTVTLTPTPSAVPVAVSPSPPEGTFLQDNDPVQLEWSA